jgi:hypothetical protein
MQFNFNKVLPENLNKDYIFSRLRQEDIIEFCTGAPPVYDKHILSPLRKETKPSFSYKKTVNGDIIWRDWGINEYGDVVKLICLKYGCSYHEALGIIYENLIQGSAVPKADVKLELLSRSAPAEKKQNLIHIKTQNYTGADYKYWSQFGISLSTLNKFKVYSAKYVWLNKFDYFQDKYRGWKLIKTYSKANPVYAFEFEEKDYRAYKIYAPLDPKFKWFFNGKDTDIQGYDMLPHLGEYVVLTKSLKDVMCLYEMGIPAISLQGEHNKLSYELFEKLMKRFHDIIIFYDNDRVGLQTSKLISEQYNLKEIFIPEKYNTKDISDTVKAYGFDEAKGVVDKLLTV